ncbi:hypothetical protein [Roseivirga pacifica]|uniref:hypothetical protein n=1 Tax=Roseivirga pacifica TaxID=1267423 RepID=UPI00227B0B63|nr:hypothetical protein [Roseivirga pacifica]
MKTRINVHVGQTIRFIFLSLILVISASSCGGGGGDDPTEPEKTPQEIAQEIFEGTWGIDGGGSINLDGTDVSDKYTGFTMNINNGSFTTTNAGELFPASGTWSWVGETDNQVTTGSGKQITLSTLSSSRLVFTFTKTSSNAMAGANGNYTVTLTK